MTAGSQYASNDFKALGDSMSILGQRIIVLDESVKHIPSLMESTAKLERDVAVLAEKLDGNQNY